MKLISGYNRAGRYKCLEDVLPEKRAELSLMYCGWESCVRASQRRRDLKDSYVLGFVRSGIGSLEMDGEVYSDFTESVRRRSWPVRDFRE